MAEERRLLQEEDSSGIDSDEERAMDKGSGPLSHGSPWTVPEQRTGRRGEVQFNRLPWGIWLLEKMGLCGFKT